MFVNNAEIINPGTVAVAPATPTNTPAKVEVTAPVVTPPTESPAEIAEKKHNLAHIKARIEKMELKEQLAKANAAIHNPSPAPVVESQAQPETIRENPPAPVQKTVSSMVEDEKKAIQELSENKTVSQIPGATMEILSMIYSYSRLSRLYNEIDPALAIREATNIYLSNAGISPAPALPVPTNPSGVMGSSNVSNLESLQNQIDKLPSGSREWTLLARKISAEIHKMGKPI